MSNQVSPQILTGELRQNYASGQTQTVWAAISSMGVPCYCFQTEDEAHEWVSMFPSLKHKVAAFTVAGKKSRSHGHRYGLGAKMARAEAADRRGDGYTAPMMPWD